MTARILSFPGAHRDHPIAKLQIVEDDWAAKVIADVDRHFWIRVEKDPGETIVVSDFAQGGLAEHRLVAGLRLALRALDYSHRTEIIFRDLVPGGTSKPLFSLRLERKAECAKRLCGAIAADSGRRVAAFNIRPRGNKMDAIARFA